MKPTLILLLAVSFLIISSCSVKSVEEVNLELKSKSMFIENGFATQSSDSIISIIRSNPVVSAKRD